MSYTNGGNGMHTIHHHHYKQALPTVREEELTPLSGRSLEPEKSSKEIWKSRAALIASILALSLCAGFLALSMVSWFHMLRSNESNSGPKRVPEYSSSLMDDQGRYVARNYDAQPPFSDFLPALAGIYGKPLYAFYVNRGQGIASFGVESKDYPLMEFESANKAYQNAALRGFRTFLQGFRKGGEDFLLEPFSILQTDFTGTSSSVERNMYIGSNEMQLQEINRKHGIEINVTFFIMPEEDYGAFVKRTTISNIANSNSVLEFSMLDGLAQIEPAGGKLDKLLKNMGRTLEAWMKVDQPYDDTIKMPFYRLSTEPRDSAAVVIQEAGHWCLSVLDDDESPKLLPIIYDPSKVFGLDTSLLQPLNLFENNIVDIINEPQYGRAKTASAFAALANFALKPGESVTIATYYGKTEHILDVPVISRRLTQSGLGLYKLTRSRELIKQITACVETTTSHDLYNTHIQQMFLDNSLRGGVPTLLGDVDDDARLRNADEDDRLKVYHLFSRIHGDLERDYNDFLIANTFFSQGPGNFRDVAQNRRNDVLFTPRIGSYNVKTFLSFIQVDGYNPLTVESAVFTIRDLNTCIYLATRAVGEADGHRAQREALTGILNSGPFRPGELFLLMEQQNIELVISRQEFMDMVAAAADFSPMGNYTTGYWADHWTYYMDLIQTYLAIYPDWEQRLLYETELPYFFSPAFVKPRSEKYVLSLTYDASGYHVRQLDPVIDNDPDKIEQMRSIQNLTGWYDFLVDWQHDVNQEIFKSSALAKLFLLATLKFATRDAYGMGIEYEGGRPGWDDANNGLVGMLGSGMPETYELVVLMRYIRSVLQKYQKALVIPAELADLVNKISEALETLQTSADADADADVVTSAVPPSRLAYWDSVASAREQYREQTKVLLSGKTVTVEAVALAEVLDAWLVETLEGIQRAQHFGRQLELEGGNKTTITPTYFSFTVTKWKETGGLNRNGHPLVEAVALKVVPFPLFLEGPVRMMKMGEPETAHQIYKAVRKSTLRDEKLKMYTLSESLKGQSLDIGREMAFAPGWLENQSVWLHMSYKFYLEMIRNGLYKEFYEEMTSGGMLPFMDPEIYGRSLTECSSFIASSAFEDPSVQGRGFLARLSGSTAEFLSMWALMMIGPTPFFLDEKTGELQMQLVPALPRWLFKNDGKSGSRLSFKLFGSITTTFHHHRGSEDLFRVPPSRYIVILRDGTSIPVDGPTIPFGVADKIRRVVFVDSIDVFFE